MLLWWVFFHTLFPCQVFLLFLSPNENSALFEHFLESGHKDFNLDKVKILDKEKDYGKRLTKEAFYIRVHEKVMNRKKEIGRFNNIYTNINNIGKDLYRHEKS